MWNRRTYRPLFWALLLSLLAHFALLGEMPGWLGHDKDAQSSIQVNLVELPPEPLPPPVPHRVSSPIAKKPAIPKAKPVVQAAPPPQPVPQTSPESAPPVMAANATPAPAEPPPAAQPPALPPVVPVDQPVVAEEEPKPMPPRHVEVEYRIVRKGGVAGIERHSYRVGDDGHYSLSSLAQAKGLLAIALSDLVQKSEGMVTPQGLKPATFLYQYGKDKDKAQKATFDWQAGTLQMETGNKRQSVPLADGAQDLMSFMYQFMFVPPLQEMRLAITNGKRLRTYDYAFDGEDTLDTPMGALRCLHISRSSDDGDKKTELWLAEDYHYLPVRMKETDKDGVVTERIANRLQME